MQTIYHPSQIAESNIDKNLYTVVIPAAGRGSRLNFNKPKITYPILDKPIGHWLFDLVDGIAKEVIVVASPEGEDSVQDMISRYRGLPCKIVIQQQPLGMADAISVSEPLITTPHVLVIWGDQVGLKRQTVESILTLHSKRVKPKLTLPTIIRKKPYIMFQRDIDNRLYKVFESREEHIKYDYGESDCGIFCFSAKDLFEQINKSRQDKSCHGQSTGELNLIPMLPKFDIKSGDVISLRIDDIAESLGVNTQEDAKNISTILKQRHTRKI